MSEEAEPRISAFELARLSIAQIGFTLSTELVRGLDRALEIASTTLGVERVGIWVTSRDTSLPPELRCLRTFNHDQNAFATGATLRLDNIPAYAIAIRSRRALVANDAWEDVRTRDLRSHYLEPGGIRALLDAPIFRAGEVIGVLCHEHVGEPRAWTKREVDFAVSVADMISSMIEQAMRIDAEERASNNSKMEGLGQLAAGVAHDFSNVLQGISLEAEKLMLVAREPEQVEVGVQEIMRHMDRGSRLVRQLLAFGKTAGLASPAQGADACQSLQELVPVLQSLLRYPWAIEVVLPEKATLVTADRSEFEQIVMNLVVNARDAMPAGGNVFLELREGDATFCELVVRDQGVGISAQARERIFEPFFTTKPPESGTGLGLAIVRRVVDRVRGSILLDSEPGKGATFTVRLPRL
jgi:two-component system, cell cycle sensor histidine kinase and response regulator CckA